MAHTRVWDEASPTDDDDAVDIDDYIRERMVDIRERMADILGADGDWATDDPVIPSTHSLSSLYAGAVAAGSQANIERTISWTAGQIISSAGTVAQTAPTLTLTGASGAVTVIIPVVLPVGVIVTSARALVRYSDADHTITASFRGHLGANLDYNQALGSPIVSGSQQWIATGVLSHTTVADTNYSFTVTLANNNLDTATELRLHAVQVKYTHPGGAIR